MKVVNFRCINNASALYHGRIHPPPTTHTPSRSLCLLPLGGRRFATADKWRFTSLPIRKKKNQKRRGYEPTRSEVKYLHGTAQRSAWVAVSRVQEERCKSKRNGKEGASAKPPKSDPLETRWTTDGCQQGL